MVMERRCASRPSALAMHSPAAAVAIVFLAEINDARATHKGVGANSRPHARGTARRQGVAWAQRCSRRWVRANAGRQRWRRRGGCAASSFGLGDQQLKVLGGHAVGDVDGLGLIEHSMHQPILATLCSAVAAALIGQFFGQLFKSSAIIASATPSPMVTRAGMATASCSAWESRSAAAQAGLTLPSLITSTSEGPASISMSTRPNTARLARVTKRLPGPTILSTALNGFRAVGDGGDGLHTADAVDLGYLGDVRRGQHGIVDAAIAAGRGKSAPRSGTPATKAGIKVHQNR